MEQLRLGFAGLGMAAGRLIPEIARLPHVRLAAAADLRPQSRERFAAEFGGETYDSVEALCESRGVDAVYVATPHEFHAPHAIAALECGKHVIVEKPMALSLTEAEAMNAAAERAGRKLMAGHTHSFDAPIRAMRALVKSGELGRLLMVSTSYYKDHLYRPFSDHDIRTSRGVVLNQGPHQVDIVRVLAGGMARSVRAMSGIGNPGRPGEGHYVAYVEFEGDVAASLVYSGYAYFDSAELTWGLGEGGEHKDPDRHRKARQLFRALGPPAERAGRLAARLEEWRYGGGAQGSWAEHAPSEMRQPFFGLTIATCEGGDVRQSPDGLHVYDEDGRREVAVERGVPAREAELWEFYDAICNDRPLVHDGRWGAATLEVCLGILQSAAEHREVALTRQVAWRD